jgi:hypothetical protein
MVMTTSKHSFIAHDLVSITSKISASTASLTFPSLQSIPKREFSAALAYISARIASAFRPAFSERVLGITSNEAPNFSTAY